MLALYDLQLQQRNQTFRTGAGDSGGLGVRSTTDVSAADIGISGADLLGVADGSLALGPLLGGTGLGLNLFAGDDGGGDGEGGFAEGMVRAATEFINSTVTAAASAGAIEPTAATTAAAQNLATNTSLYDLLIAPTLRNGANQRAVEDAYAGLLSAMLRLGNASDAVLRRLNRSITVTAPDVSGLAGLGGVGGGGLLAGSTLNVTVRASSIHFDPSFIAVNSSGNGSASSASMERTGKLVLEEVVVSGKLLVVDAANATTTGGAEGGGEGGDADDVVAHIPFTITASRLAILPDPADAGVLLLQVAGAAGGTIGDEGAPFEFRPRSPATPGADAADDADGAGDAASDDSEYTTVLRIPAGAGVDGIGGGGLLTLDGMAALLDRLVFRPDEVAMEWDPRNAAYEYVGSNPWEYPSVLMLTIPSRVTILHNSSSPHALPIFAAELAKAQYRVRRSKRADLKRRKRSLAAAKRASKQRKLADTCRYANNVGCDTYKYC
jgi:hypothetical protein